MARRDSHPRIHLGIARYFRRKWRDAGKAEAIQLAHEVTGGVHLVLERKLRAFGERGIEDCGVGTRDEEAGRISFAVVLDLASWRVWSFFGVATGPQRSLVQQGPAIKIQDEHWRFRRGVVDLFQRRHATFDKLEFRPAAYHANPLARRSALRLMFKHSERIVLGGYAIPTRLPVLTEGAPKCKQM